MLSSASGSQVPIEVSGRLVRARHELAPVRVALAVEHYEDSEFDAYLVEHVGRGQDLARHVDELVTVAAWLTVLPTGEPLLRVRSYERW